MIKVLVLGITGMLGSMVYDVLSKDRKYEIRGTARKLEFSHLEEFENKPMLFDAEKDIFDEKIFSDFKPDYVINCIGVIKPYCKEGDENGIVRAIKINALFPHILAKACRDNDIRVVQLATDCVYSGEKGGYIEGDSHDALDVYGKTKSLGEVYCPNFLNIRASIIGPEINNKLSLLEWFLSKTNDEEINGYSHHKWNGVSTLQFAEICNQVMSAGKERFDDMVRMSPVVHLVLNQTVNKNELLKIFNRVFEKGVQIIAVDNVGRPVDRSIATKFDYFKKDGLVDMEVAVRELKKYMESNKTWPRNI